MKTFADIIDAWPSQKALAEDRSVRPSLVAVWRHRNSIPPAHWKGLVEDARRRGIPGVTLDLLAAIAAGEVPPEDGDEEPYAGDPPETAAASLQPAAAE